MMSFQLVSRKALVVGGLIATSLSSHAQVSIDIGAAPDCPYGYYDAAPYACAPYGYYGTEWFDGGLFIGAGPWFHGAYEFRGHVNNRLHPDHGYRGSFPNRGERPDPMRHPNQISHFDGNEMRDGRGHVGGFAGGHGRR